jgi:hypothetical protein
VGGDLRELNVNLVWILIENFISSISVGQFVFPVLRVPKSEPFPFVWASRSLSLGA